MRSRPRLAAFPVFVAAACLAGCLAGCNGETVKAAPKLALEAPILLSTSSDKVAIGQTLSFYGGSFLNDDGNVQITFSGTYYTYGAGSSPVSLTITPKWVTGNQIDWTSFGPFWIPFGNGRTLGTFKGTVTATNVRSDGTTASSAPLTLSLEILPSIVLDAFAPVMSNGCPGPVKRILGGYPYLVTVEAVGFTPLNFTLYQISPTFTPPPLRYPASGPVLTFGQNNEIYFPPVLDQQTFYVTQFTISSLGSDDHLYGVTYNFGVHKPIEYLPTGPAQIAEYEAPVPIGGCIPSNQFGQSVTYMDTETEDQTRQVAYTWDQSWQKSQESMQTKGTSVTNSVNLSVADTTNAEWSAGWNVGVDTTQGTTDGWSQNYETNSNTTTGTNELTGTSDTVNGQLQGSALGIGGTAGGNDMNESSGGSSTSSTVGNSDSTGSNNSVQNSMTDQVGENGSQSVGENQTTTVGADHAEDDTESWAFSDTNGYTVSQGNNSFWSVSSSSSISTGETYQLLPGYDGWWYRQTTRLAYPGEVITYDLCSQPTVAATAYFYDYVWAVSMAVGQSCTQGNMPTPSEFPPAACYIGCGSN